MEVSKMEIKSREAKKWAEGLGRVKSPTGGKKNFHLTFRRKRTGDAGSRN
jgi:hypothetical protein